MSPRWMIAVDASTSRTLLVLGRVGDGVDDIVVQQDDGARASGQASAELPRRIAAAVASAGIRVSDLSLVACGRGPGTFTGTRVAVALCKGLAEGLGCPIVGVSTLAAQAASVDGPSTVTALLDARRDEVYAARYAIDGASVEPLSTERCVAIEAALADGRGDRFVGPGVAAYRARIRADVACVEMDGPSATGLWRAASSALAREGALDPAALEAVYLRESYAELGVNVPRNPTFRSPLLGDDES
jgi:tRNA threonylcarbamoyl adenosine modification protein YeaZ